MLLQSSFHLAIFQPTVRNFCLKFVQDVKKCPKTVPNFLQVMLVVNYILFFLFFCKNMITQSQVDYFSCSDWKLNMINLFDFVSNLYVMSFICL